MQYIALHCYDKIIGSKTLREYLFIFNIDEDYLNMTDNRLSKNYAANS